MLSLTSETLVTLDNPMLVSIRPKIYLQESSLNVFAPLAVLANLLAFLNTLAF